MQYETIRPDVEFEYNGEKVYVEIFVTHSVDKNKIEFYKSNKLHSFETNLSSYEYESRDQIITDILNSKELKKIISWKRKYHVRSNIYSIIQFLVITLGLYCILIKLFSCRSSNKNKRQKNIKYESTELYNTLIFSCISKYIIYHFVHTFPLSYKTNTILNMRIIIFS